ARFTEFFEMCLGTFGKTISFRFGSVTKPGYIPATIQYGSDILTRRGRRRQQHNHCKSPTNSTHADLQSAPPSLVQLQIGQLSIIRILRSSELVALTKNCPSVAVLMITRRSATSAFRRSLPALATRRRKISKRGGWPEFSYRLRD